jgi:hypothetical protein
LIGVHFQFIRPSLILLISAGINNGAPLQDCLRFFVLKALPGLTADRAPVWRSFVEKNLQKNHGGKTDW